MAQPIDFVRIQKNLAQSDTEQGNNTDFAEAEQTINAARATLSAQKKEILDLSADQRILQWKNFNFDRHADLLEFLKLPSRLGEARDQHPGEAKNICLAIEKCENELGAIEIDIRRKTTKPHIAVAQAKKTVEHCSIYKGMVETWRGHVTALLTADKVVRDTLSVAALLPLVKEMSRKNADFVADGYVFFCMIKGAGPTAGNPSMHDFIAQAVDLEKRIKTIDLNGLTGIAQAIVEHHLHVVLAATDQIKSFIEHFLKNLPGEILFVEKAQQELSNLSKTSAPVILEKLEPIAGQLARNLIDLRHKSKTMKQINLLPIILEEIRRLHFSLKSTIIPEVKRCVLDPASPINPSRVASEKTADFFMGMKGFMRAMKLLFGSMGGQKAIRSEDLHKLLVEILNSCEIYYGNTPAEVKKLQNFLEAKLHAFERPFPYEGIYQTAKEAIAAYGSRVEKFLFGFEVSDLTDDETETAGSLTKKTSLGRLIAKLEVRTANLESARS